MLKSVYYDQDEILQAIQTLHSPSGFCADLTYGSGGFWKPNTKPRVCFDLVPRKKGVVKADSGHLPILESSLRSCVFDPPFLTYIKPGHSSIMAKRFGGYWTYDDLIDHYFATLREAQRALVSKGVMVFKCQDIIHNHRMHAVHIDVVTEAVRQGYRLRDLFILAAKHRMPMPGKSRTQRHARVFHSYFLVLENARK